MDDAAVMEISQAGMNQTKQAWWKGWHCLESRYGLSDGKLHAPWNRQKKELKSEKATKQDDTAVLDESSRVWIGCFRKAFIWKKDK
jgi:hypothetical protein